MINEPTTINELRDMFLKADQNILDDYTDFAEKGTEDRVTLLEERLLIMGTTINALLKLIGENKVVKLL